jgi:hypothetical protein
MILNGKPLGDLTIDDFRGLIEDQTPEGPHIEYKETAYSGRDQDRREMLRDITAFANSMGGYLVLGIQEDALGRAARLTPVTNPHATKKAMKQACLDGISERIPDLEIQAYDTGPDQGIIVVRVPPSEYVPHMVKLDRRTEFVRRYDDSKQAMTIGEIRTAVLSVPAYRQLIAMEQAELERQAVIGVPTESGPPYVQALTERPVEKFLYRYMVGGATAQALVVVSPFISDLNGAMHNLEAVLAKVRTDGTRLVVVTRPPMEAYQHHSLAALKACPYAEVRFNPDIHAKLYICWKREERESFALFGSGNLTSAGVFGNIELGMMVLSRGHGKTLVRQLYDWSAVGLRASSQLIQGATKWRGEK